MRRLLTCALLTAALASQASVTVLNNSSHAASNIRCGVNAVAPGALDVTIFVDMSSASPDSSFDVNMVAHATDGARTNFASLDSAPVNHAPYAVITNSFTNYSNTVDRNNYNTLIASSTVDNWAYVPSVALPSTAVPPAAAVAVNQGFAGAKTGFGIEFGLSSAYKGCDTSSPSGGTALMAGLLAAAKLAHPTWTWADIKGAFRQTSANWATGYDPTNYGYGILDYDAAIALSPSGIYLQPPAFYADNHASYATLVVYPMVTTRRAREVIYIGGTWPAASAGNELTAAQIASAGGTKIFDDGGATGAQSFTYAPITSGSATFTALTLDASGNGSRVEAFGSVAQSFLIGTACLQ